MELNDKRVAWLGAETVGTLVKTSNRRYALTLRKTDGTEATARLSLWEIDRLCAWLDRFLKEEFKKEYGDAGE